MVYSLRAGERGRGDASSGLFPAGDSGVAAAAREGRQAARRAGPSPGRGRRAAVDAYLVAGGVEDAKAPLFQSVERSGRLLSGRSLTRRVVLAMIKRRAAAAGLPASTCCHTFRATGITAYLSNGGTLEHAQQIAGHASPRTTKLYDRTADTVNARRDRTHRDLTGGDRARPGVARPAVTLSSPALLGSTSATCAGLMKTSPSWRLPRRGRSSRRDWRPCGGRETLAIARRSGIG